MSDAQFSYHLPRFFPLSEFFQLRYVELWELNKEQLKRGEMQTGEVIKIAAARLIIG